MSTDIKTIKLVTVIVLILILVYKWVTNRTLLEGYVTSIKDDIDMNGQIRMQLDSSNAPVNNIIEYLNKIS